MTKRPPADAIVAEVINLDGRLIIKVTQYGYLYARGYYSTIEEVQQALGEDMAKLVVREK